MTIDKSKEVTIPVWLVSTMLSVLGGGVIAWGVVSAKASTLELKAQINTNNIEMLRKEKVDKEQFNMVLNKLNSIEVKIDTHMTQR